MSRKENTEKHTKIILHNIRSAYNVGAMFRTADAAGVSEIVLTGYTPSPTDRFGRARKDVTKTALGAERSVPWRASRNLARVIGELQQDSFFVVGVEQSPRAADYRHLPRKNKTAFVFGNEVRGLSRAALCHCDTVAEIPMKGAKESLNVSVAAGVILFNNS